MPIYAYKCDSCGFSKDVLQKFSDAPLTDCPSCGAPSFNKQLTAPGFQLKGSGWYATDFKGAKPGPAAPAGATEPAAAPKDGGSTAPDAGASKTEAAASGCAASCACH
jgi:putative FmdB family regulatory protein